MNNAPTQARDGDGETVETTAAVPSETPEASHGDATPSRLGRWASQINQRRLAKVVSAETVAAQKRLLQQRREEEAQRDRETASQTAASRRKAQAARQETETETDPAPVPHWMKWIGAWFDRSFGSSPLIAPLIVSGVYTMKTGMDAPLHMSWAVALFFTLGLEGSLWYLSRLYEQTRLEGDSTFSLRVGMIGIILLIAGLIGGHAIWEAMGSVQIMVDLPWTERQIPLEKAVPAIAVAVMSAIGTFVWSKRATFRHRVKLRQQNLIDPRAPKFSTWSWILDGPQTFLALRHAVRYRISSPVLAVEDRRLWVMSQRPKVWPLVETVDAELVETPSRETVRVKAETSARETTHLVSVSPLRPLSSSPETATVSGDGNLSVSTVSAETETVDQVETVGRLRDGDGLSYAKIALRLGVSKAQAGRLGQQYDKRLRLRLETGETETEIAT